MKEHQIYVLAIPPHTSHIVQALDSMPLPTSSNTGKLHYLNGIMHTRVQYLINLHSFKYFGQPLNIP